MRKSTIIFYQHCVVLNVAGMRWWWLFFVTRCVSNKWMQQTLRTHDSENIIFVMLEKLVCHSQILVWHNTSEQDRVCYCTIVWWQHFKCDYLAKVNYNVPSHNCLFISCCRATFFIINNFFNNGGVMLSKFHCTCAIGIWTIGIYQCTSILSKWNLTMNVGIAYCTRCKKY